MSQLIYESELSKLIRLRNSAPTERRKLRLETYINEQFQSEQSQHAWNMRLINDMLFDHVIHLPRKDDSNPCVLHFLAEPLKYEN